MAIDAIKSLRKLDEAELLPYLGIHQEAHGFPHGLTVIEVMIAVEVQDERCIRKDCRNSNLCSIVHNNKSIPVPKQRSKCNNLAATYQSILCPGFLMVLIARSFLTRDVHEPW